MEIIKGRPFPQGRKGIPIPFEEMDVGDCVIIPLSKFTGKGDPLGNMRSRCTIASFKAHCGGPSFRARRTDEGIGIWRIA